MPTLNVNNTDLHYEVQGEGAPVFLVHGSWADHTNWFMVAAGLAESFRVVSYDRRGHSRSERPSGARTRRMDEDDLAALIDALGPGPAHIVGNSFGGLVALGLAGRRPDLVASVTVHEPPALSVAAGGELSRLALDVKSSLAVVLGELAAGETVRGTRRFMEEIALGPGAWALLPEPMRETWLANAPAFMAEQRDPDAVVLDVDALHGLPCPVLLTRGDTSPPWLMLLADRLAEVLPDADTATIAGAGHVPHLTNPVEYTELVSGFIASASREPAGVA